MRAISVGSTSLQLSVLSLQSLVFIKIYEKVKIIDGLTPSGYVVAATNPDGVFVIGKCKEE